MKRAHLLLLLCFLSFSLVCLTSCKDKEVLSEGARVAQEIRNTVGSTTTIRVVAYMSGGASIINQSQELVLQGDFVVVDGNHFNLAKLVRYRYTPPSGSTAASLSLYF